EATPHPVRAGVRGGVVEAVDAVLGLSPNVARQLAGAMLATSDEAESLLKGMPNAMRSLSISTSERLVECRGELRGPVAWSETMSRRSATSGAQDLYMCSSPARAYDVLENRVLVAALGAVSAAGRSVESMSAQTYDDDTMRRARSNGTRALRYLDHRSLSGVTRERPTPRSLNRAKVSSRRATYTPALRMLERASEPLGADDVLPFCDRRTRLQHDLLVGVLEGLEGRDSDVGPLRAIDGSLEAGGVRYSHPRRRGDRERPHGIQLGGLLLDVPERLRDRHRARNQHLLARRAGSLEARIVLEQADIDLAVEDHLARTEAVSW
ncbi:MAG: hypothetical protein AAGK32_14810, partial [Actinomycetota bacterium]